MTFKADMFLLLNCSLGFHKAADDGLEKPEKNTIPALTHYLKRRPEGGDNILEGLLHYRHLLPYWRFLNPSLTRLLAAILLSFKKPEAHKKQAKHVV
jgi:hypothetical protein